MGSIIHEIHSRSSTFASRSDAAEAIRWLRLAWQHRGAWVRDVPLPRTAPPFLAHLFLIR